MQAPSPASGSDWVSTAPTRPQLHARHCAMLAEMGVSVWWQQGAQSIADPVAPRRVLEEAPAPVVSMPPVRDKARSVAVVAQPAPVAAAIPPTVQQVTMDVPMAQEALQQAICTCTACPLAARRRHAVPGMGDMVQPDWLIVGEAPGEEEDKQGLPFVGKAGQLLDKMLLAMGLSRQHKVYIANVIKCRPPQNRNPEPQELAQCQPYLLRQIELLQPRFVLALGRFATDTLLAYSPQFSAESVRKIPIGKLRGQVYQIDIAGQRLPLVVSYHPAYLLRTPADKSKSWADLCLALDAFAHLPPRTLQTASPNETPI